MKLNSDKKQNINYAILSIPLAFVGIPIYINVGDFYLRQFDINLTYLAFIILLVRLIDAIQEPLLGLFSDFLIKKNITHKNIIYFSSFLLAISFFMLFNPLQFLNKFLILVWLTISMLATYSFFNLTLINFEALAVIIAKDSKQRTAINSYKESFGLVGILVASATPTILTYILGDSKNSYFYLSLIFIALLFLIIIGFFRRIPDYKIPPNLDINGRVEIEAQLNIKKTFLEILAHKTFVKLMLIILVNSIAVSLPASMITFFVNDFLKVPQKLGFFLVIYFLSAVLFINFWKLIVDKFGKIFAWRCSIIGSVATFIFAYFINEFNYEYFYFICFFAGVFLGADLIVPPTLISQIIHDKQDKISSYIGLWSMVNKAGLMLASFFSLMILDQVGFVAGSLNYNAMLAIPMLYALAPCALKLLVFLLLIKSKNLKKI